MALCNSMFLLLQEPVLQKIKSPHVKMERARLEKHDLQVIEINKSTVPYVVVVYVVSLCESSMSNETETTAESTQYFFKWMRIDPRALKVMGKRPRRTFLQVNQHHFVKNVPNMASWDGYKGIHKQATLMWQERKSQIFLAL